MSFGDDTLSPDNDGIDPDALEYAVALVARGYPLEQQKRDALTHIYNAARAVLQLGGQSQQMRTLEECCDDYHRLIKTVETTDDA